MLEIRRLSPDFCDVVYSLEIAGFPADEAASREKLMMRLTHAFDYVCPPGLLFAVP